MAAAKPPEVTAAISDAGIWHCAASMVEGYGDNALCRAAIVAQQMQVQGDAARAAAWKRILRAIGELQRPVPDGAVH